jgi:predicted secreted protein
VPRADELPKRLVLGVGEERTIELPGLGTAGYAWHHELGGDTGAVEASWKRGLRVTSKPRPVGQSAPEVLTVHALRPGHVKIRVAQRRPWERDTPPLRQHEFDIEVTE